MNIVIRCYCQVTRVCTVFCLYMLQAIFPYNDFDNHKPCCNLFCLWTRHQRRHSILQQLWWRSAMWLYDESMILWTSNCIVYPVISILNLSNPHLPFKGWQILLTDMWLHKLAINNHYRLISVIEGYIAWGWPSCQVFYPPCICLHARLSCLMT